MATSADLLDAHYEAQHHHSEAESILSDLDAAINNPTPNAAEILDLAEGAFDAAKDFTACTRLLLTSAKLYSKARGDEERDFEGEPE